MVLGRSLNLCVSWFSSMLKESKSKYITGLRKGSVFAIINTPKTLPLYLMGSINLIYFSNLQSWNYLSSVMRTVKYISDFFYLQYT